MKRNGLFVAACSAIAVVATVVGSVVLASEKESSPEPKCKLSPVDAIRVAKGKASGRTLQATFEYEDGKWVYGVMIVSGKSIKEVMVDANTGKIGDIEAVTPDGEAKEIKAELEKAIGAKAQSKAK